MKNKGVSRLTRTEKTLRNARYGVACQLVVLLTGFVSRRVIISYLAAEYLSVGGLFSNIMTVLSLAELGVGAAITYSLYKPLSEGDEGKICSLMRLFRRAYTVIGLSVLALGCAILPLLRFFVDDIDAALSAVPDFYIIYVLYVVNSSVSYFLAYKRTLLIADQRRYVTSITSSVSQIVLCAAAFLLLGFTKNYVLFMAATVFVTAIENVIISIIARRVYPYLNYKNTQPLEDSEKSTIKTNVKAALMHNIGGVLVNGTDNIIISRFVSFLAEGLYTNFHLISAAADSLLRPVFQSATASFGDLSVEADNEKKTVVFHRMFFAGAWLYGLCAICIANLSLPTVTLWLGEEFGIDTFSIMLVALNFYLVGMRRPGMSAREAMGLLRYDRWKSIIEAVLNIILSVILAKNLGIAGVLLGTTISSLSTCFWIEPLVLFRHGLGHGLGKYFARYGIYSLVTGAAFAATYLICDAISVGGIGGLLIKGLVCLTVTNLLYVIAYFKFDEFKYFYKLLLSKIKKPSNKSASEK